MGTIILVIDVILAIVLVGLVLVQRSDGALGSIGGGASSMMSTRARGNFLTKSTAVVAALFMICSIALAIMSKPDTNTKTVILEDGAIGQLPASQPEGTEAIPAPFVPQPTSAPISAE